MGDAGTAPCPEEDQLLAFVEARLTGAPLDGLLAHVATCDHCLAAIGELGGSASLSDGSGRPVTSFQVGDQVAGRYRIKRFIARGGMGEVYEADDDLLGMRVALKTVLPDNEARPRAIEFIRREVQVARAINHRNVCRVFDLGEHVPAAGGGGRRFFLTMEFLEGVTLGQQIRGKGALPPDRLLLIAHQLADGLLAAHEAGVVHRDFKSDNVMLLAGSQGDTPRAVIMDFGLARGGPLGVGLSSTGGAMVGSAAYMAPEQVQGGSISHAADIYAFGVVLYQAATGTLPFIGATAMATATKRLMEKPPAPRSRVPDLDQRLEDIILRCLAFMPEDRYPSMVEIKAALAGLDQPIAEPVAAVVGPVEPAGPAGSAVSTVTGRPAPAPEVRRRVPWWAAVLVAGAVIAAIVAATLIRAAGERSPTETVKGSAMSAPAITSPAPALAEHSPPAPIPPAAVERDASSSSPSVPVGPPASAAAPSARPVSARPVARDGGRNPRAAGAGVRAATDVPPATAPAADAAQRSRSTMDGIGDNPFQR